MDSFEVVFSSEITGRYIYETREIINDLVFGIKRGIRKLFADGRKKRMNVIPTPRLFKVNTFLLIKNSWGQSGKYRIIAVYQP